MLPLGMQFAASGLVGTQIGAHKPKQAQRYAILVIFVTLTITFIVCMFFNIYDYEVARIFTQDPETVKHITEVLPILSIYLFFDALHGVQSGNIRAVG